MVVFNIDVKIKETGGSKAVKSGLIQIQKTADKTQKVVERIGRRVRHNGIKRFNKELKKTSNNAKGLKRLLTQTFGVIGVGLLIRKVVELSDVYQNFQNRMKLVTTGTENLRAVTAELFNTANETRSAFSATAELFTRVSIATKNLGRSQREVINFTKTLNKAVILSGTTAAEAKNGIIQLSQGLASGALRGDELRSVLEQLPAVADAIANSMNITRGELRKMGEAGKITADVVLDAMAKAAEDIDRNFATTIPTISQAFTVLNNEVQKTIGTFNQSTGAASGLALAIIAISKFVGPLSISLLVFAAAWATVALQAHFAAVAMNESAVAALRAKIALHPVAAAFVAIAVATAFATSAIADYFDEVDKREQKEAGKSAKDKAIERIQGNIAELDRLRRQLKITGETSGATADRFKSLSHALAVNQDILRSLTGGERQFTEEKDKAASATEDIIAKLKGQAAAHRDLTTDQRIGLKVLKQIAKIDKASGISDLKDNEGKNTKRIRTQLELTAAAKEYRKTIDSIKQPQEEMNLALQSLSVAMGKGKITVAEFQVEVAKMRDIPELDFGGKFGLAVVNAQMEVTAVKLSGLRVGFTETTEILANLAVKGVAGLDTMGEKIAWLSAQEEKGGEKAAAFRLAIDKLLGDPVEQTAAEGVELLTLKLEKGLITQTQWNEQARALGPIGKKAATTFESGMVTAFEKITDEASNLAKVGEDIVNVFADSAVDAINSFVETGKFKFKEFAADLLKQISRIIVRLLIVKALSAVAGAATGGASTVVTAAANAGIDAGTQAGIDKEARAGGGRIEPGRPYLVGEDGVETIVPNQASTVIPAGRTAGEPAPAPEVNVHVTNVTDPDEIPAAIEDGQFDKQIVNLIARNRDIIKQGLQ